MFKPRFEKPTEVILALCMPMPASLMTNEWHSDLYIFCFMSGDLSLVLQLQAMGKFPYNAFFHT